MYSDNGIKFCERGLIPRLRGAKEDRIREAALQVADFVARSKGLHINVGEVTPENRYGFRQVLIVVNKKRYVVDVYDDYEMFRLLEQFGAFFRRLLSKRHFRHGLKPKSRRIIMVKGRCG